MIVEAHDLRADLNDDGRERPRLMRRRRCIFLHRWVPADHTKKGTIALHCTRCSAVQEWMPPWSDQVGSL
jgi:hypothetical protein